jgi:phosphatidylglycerophosphate synthase
MRIIVAMNTISLPTLDQIREAHSWKREYERYLPLSRYFYRPIGFLLTWMAVRIGLTTEAVSWLSGILGIGGLLFLMGKSLNLIWVGIGLLVLFNLLDCVDGSIARVKKTENPYGKFLDSVLGDFIDFAFFAAVGIMAYRHPLLVDLNSRSEDGTLLCLAIGGLTGFFYILLVHIEQIFHYQIRKLQLNEEKRLQSNKSGSSNLVSGIVMKINTEAKWKSTLRWINRNLRVRETHYLFLVFALLFNSVDIFLIIFLVYYILHTFLTSIVYFNRAKQLRGTQLGSQ